jgi:inorganic pyrophosphatase
MDERFWQHADELLATSPIVIDRPRGSQHPHYSDTVYPLDYGYLAGTVAGDRAGIDVWLGSLPLERATGAILTIDLSKRDAEVKLLAGCTREEQNRALAMHQISSQAALLIPRSTESEPT